MVVINWVLWFFVYSFLGWAYETTICSIAQREFINRGFLNGPICPIYGVGAVLCILLLETRIHSVIALFFFGMILTCTVEYTTAVLLEKLFHAKWWDYSEHRFNINGRVCLLGAVVFGLMTVLLIKVIHPILADLILKIPEYLRVIFTLFLLTLLVVDLVLTVSHLLRLNKNLKEIEAAITSFISQYARQLSNIKDVILEKFEESEFYNERIKNLFNQYKNKNIRIIHAFPRFKSLKYNAAFQKLKEKLVK